MLCQCGGKQPLSSGGRIVYRYAGKTAAGGVTLQDEAGDSGVFQLCYFAAAPIRHLPGQVVPGFDSDETGCRRVAGQAHRFAWHSEAALYLGADREKLEKGGEGGNKLPVEFMTAVIARLFADKTSADADQYPAGHGYTLTSCSATQAGRSLPSRSTVMR